MLKDKLCTRLNGALFIIVLLLTFVSNASSTKNFNRDIQRIIDKVRHDYGLVGIQASINPLDKKKTLYNFVSGTIERDGNVALKTSNLFQIGSETKSFIAVILLQLEAEGLLSLDEPIGKWLSVLPDWQAITIRQLLNHTSGIFNYTESDEFWSIESATNFQEPWTAEELINFSEPFPSYFIAGQGWHYSDTNYILAGLLIRTITGHTVEQEVNSRLLKPLHLQHTFYISAKIPKKILNRMAHGYQENAERVLDATDVNMSFADAAGAIISTSQDTAIWLRELFTSNKLLPPKQRRELMSLVDDSTGEAIPMSSKRNGYGLGITRDFDEHANEIWGHTGGMPGYVSNMVWVKSSHIIITTLINGSNGEASYNLIHQLIEYMTTGT